MALTEREQLDVVLSLINTKVSLPKFKKVIKGGKQANEIIGSYEVSLLPESDLFQLRNLSMDLLNKLIPQISIQDISSNANVQKIETVKENNVKSND